MDDTSPGIEQETSAENLLAVGEEVRKRRGRPPGSKNRPKDGSESPKVNEGNQRRIFAGALVALFAILGVVAGWFGYEYYEKLTVEEGLEGGTYLIPISQKIGWIAATAFYLSFPAWMILKASEKFRKKVEPFAAEPTVPAGHPANGSQVPAGNSAVTPSPGIDGSPAGGDTGFHMVMDDTVELLHNTK